jgi:beta-lactamase superfamily II metal-dependent hydrolase
LIERIDYSTPSDDEIEVTVIGSGVGESIVAHVGGGDWVIVDSHLVPDTKNPAARLYLDALKVSRDSVVAIVTTHWDDDHLAGTARLLRHYRLAAFHCTAAMLKEEFRAIMRARHPDPDALMGDDSPAESRISEIRRILHLLEEEENGERGPRRIELNSWLGTTAGINLPVRVVAPHPAAGRALELQFQDAAHNRRSRRRGSLQVRDRNLGSAVLWLTSGSVRALLAGDLVNSNAPLLGWTPVVNALSKDARGQLYKAAHHGSPRSQDHQVWALILSPQPHVAVTAFTRSGLPPVPVRASIAAQTHRGIVAGESSKQQMAFWRGQDSFRVQNATTDGRGLVRQGSTPGIIRYRTPSGGDHPRDWAVAVDGNVHSITTGGSGVPLP